LKSRSAAGEIKIRDALHIIDSQPHPSVEVNSDEDDPLARLVHKRLSKRTKKEEQEHEPVIDPLVEREMLGEKVIPSCMGLRESELLY